MNKIIDYPAWPENYTFGRSGSKISEITIHHSAGVNTAANIGNTFKQPGRNGSAHYGIGYDGSIGRYVSEKDTAWTNSNWEANCRAVTIEVSNSKNYDPYDANALWEVSDKAYKQLIFLVADIAKRNNLGLLVKGKNVTWHSMYAATICPGKYLLSKMDDIIQKANDINYPTGWVKDSKGWQYLVLGTPVKNAWKKDTKDWCYVGNDGYLVTNDWVKDSKGWCYVGKDGRLVRNKKFDSTIYIDDAGHLILKGSKEVGVKW